MEYDTPVTYRQLRENSEAVAWRLFLAPRSGTNRAKPATLLALTEFCVRHRIAMIGWMKQQMSNMPNDYAEFRARFVEDWEAESDEDYGKQNTSIAFLFAKRVHKGDVVLLCHGLKRPLYWARVKSPEGVPGHLDDSDRHWKEFRPLKKQLESDGYWGHFRNFHWVDEWRPIDAAALKLPINGFPGQRQHTFYAYKLKDVARWTGISVADFRGDTHERAKTPPVPKESRHWSKAQGWERDPRKRKACESAAVAAAKQYFGKKGYRLVEEKGKPYDLHFASGKMNLHVEVKGTTSDGAKVIITRGEKRHWDTTDADMQLFVLPAIRFGLRYKIIGWGKPIVRKLRPPKYGQNLVPTHYELTV